jgi:hypothetical protein
MRSEKSTICNCRTNVDDEKATDLIHNMKPDALDEREIAR